MQVLRKLELLLRRFLEHFRHQNWIAVGLDLVVVVLGILTGNPKTAGEQWGIKRENGDLITARPAKAQSPDLCAGD